MTRSRIAFLATAAVVLVSTSVASTSFAASRRADLPIKKAKGAVVSHVPQPQVVAADGTLPDLVDLNMPALPQSSGDVLVNRLAVLGAPSDAIMTFRAQVEGFQDEAPSDELLASLAEPLGLSPALTNKAVRMAQALLDGDSVSLVGVDAPESFMEEVQSLRTGGIDADVATWLARGELTLSGNISPEGIAAMSKAAELGSIRLGGDRRIGVGTAVGDFPSAPPVSTAFCRTCPAVDVLMGTPTTTYATTQGTLDAGSCKIYRFTVAANKNYRFSFCEGGGSATFDTNLDAMSAGCVAQGSNDNFCGTASQLDVSSAGAGYAYVKVSSPTNAAGSYTLAFKQLSGTTQPGCTTCPAFDYGTYTPVDNYQTVSGTVPANGCRIVRFNVSLSHSYRFTFCDGGGTANFDTQLQTYTGNCLAGPFNDDACAGGLSAVDVTSNATQFAYVRILGGSTGGNWTLAYRDTTLGCPGIPNFSFGTFTPTPVYQTHSSTLTQAGQCKLYKFNLSAGSQYNFTFCEGGSSASFDTVLTIYDASGNFLAQNDDNCGPSSHLTWTAAYSGTHYVYVESFFGSGTGNYVLAYVEACKPQVACTNFQYGPFTPTTSPAFSGPISMPRDGCKYYSFNLLANKTYQFSLCNSVGGASSFNSRLRLLDASCSQLADDSNFCGIDGQINYRTASAGSYYLRVLDQSASTNGAYLLEYADLDCKSCADATFDRFYPTVTTSFVLAGADATAQGCWKVYKFTTVVGTQYKFSTCSGDGGASAAFDSTIDVYGNGCGLLAKTTNVCGDDEKVVVVADSTTTYVVIRGANPDVDYGAFNLSFKSN
jgi:hypothetical protein